MSTLTQLLVIWKDLYRYQWVYLLRSLILQVLVGVAGSYLLSEVFYLVLLLAREDQLTQANVTHFLSNPWSVLGLIGYLFLLALLIYIEFALLVDIVRRKDRQLAWSWQQFRRHCQDFTHLMAGWQLLPFLGYIILTIPVVQGLVSSSLLDNLRIPYFITDEWLKRPVTAIPLVSVIFLVYYINLRLIYVMPLTVVRFQERFWDNMVKSWELTRGQVMKLTTSLFILYLPIGAALFVGLLGLVALLFLLDYGILSQGLQWVVVTFIWGFSFFLTMGVKFIAISYLLSELNKHDLARSYDDLPHVPRRKRWIVLLGIFFLGAGQFITNYDRLSYNPYNKGVQTIAHRGDVTKGVENSIEALEAAAAAGVDYVEMDIILSKDHQFIVSHDNNLKRLTGKNIAISDSKASEVIGLPISQGEMTSQLVSFETYVKRAKELGVKLMVELKPHGNEPENYDQLVVDTFQKLGITKSYKLMSLNLDIVEAVETMAPEIETGYIIPLQFGDLAFNHLDFLLLEDFSYRDRLVWEAKWRHQELYVWTINREEQMRRYLQTPVYGIITDELELLTETKADLERHNSYLDRLLRLID